jgi:hypothetical protein
MYEMSSNKNNKFQKFLLCNGCPNVVPPTREIPWIYLAPAKLQICIFHSTEHNLTMIQNVEQDQLPIEQDTQFNLFSESDLNLCSKYIYANNKMYEETTLIQLELVHII